MADTVNPEWDGITKAESLHDESVEKRHALSNAAKAYNWDEVIRLVNQDPDLINATRLDSDARYTPLHQAAHGGAPREVAERLIDMGAWRTLRTRDGERPIDIASKRGHRHLLDILEPVFLTEVRPEVLRQIQRYFHVVILGRAEELVRENDLRLPELEPLLEMKSKTEVWFAIPGMYGGFNYWLEQERDPTRLICESWSRVVGGSGQRHEITVNSCNLVEEGFV